VRIPRGVAAFAHALAQHGLSVFGAALTTSAALTLIAFWVVEFAFGARAHPYAGIVLFLILPAFFVLGLLLIPLGLLLARRRARARGAAPPDALALDLANPTVRRGLRLFLALSVVNVVLLGLASYRGIEYMDSTQFCGAACHSVMTPEYVAYQHAPHSQVACVECHIGPGATSLVKAKLSGVRQLVMLARGTYSRPIPPPVRRMRPAQETCGNCHGPNDRREVLAVRTHYAEDEKNAPSTSVLVMKLGGGTGAGIHGRHLDPKVRITYVATDDSRQTIPAVDYTDASGQTVHYVAGDAAAAPAPGGGLRRAMDCTDCHNRPSHTFEMPARALDKAIADGLVSRELPFVKKTAMALLRGSYADGPAAARDIAAGLQAFYRDKHPDVYRTRRDLVDAAGTAVAAIYARNVFPTMKIGWGTYPNNVGHDDSPGCFRCHDDNHKSAKGATITQDCEACHNVLAQDEADPKALATFGVAAPR